MFYGMIDKKKSGLYCLNLEEGVDRLSRNVGNQPST
jgi:hypothetical protein